MSCAESTAPAPTAPPHHGYAPVSIPPNAQHTGANGMLGSLGAAWRLHAALNSDAFAALAFGLTVAAAVARWLATGEIEP